MEDFIIEYIEKLVLSDYLGVGIIGSYATSSHKKWSDVDLVCVVEEKRDNKVEIFKDHYFSVSYYTQDDFETYIKRPSLQLNGLEALKQIKIIYDPKSLLKEIKTILSEFSPTSVDKERSLYLAKNEYVGYIEEAQKALQGYMDHHVGKMLNGIYGLTYGMFQVIRLRDYLSITSDNDFYECVMTHLDEKDPIKVLAPQAFGLESTQLEDQVEAGLEIFMHVGNSLMTLFTEDEKEYGLKLIHEIIKEV
ncbi:MAG: nucleotidyltransferase domain-containing protein [Clostridiales bacterium]|nr:nucleotidyltransferase domain-containing protein [Clostridiales bacterium]